MNRNRDEDDYYLLYAIAFGIAFLILIYTALTVYRVNEDVREIKQQLKLNAPIVKKEINISLRDTIINDNAHLSIINIDNVEYLYLRNGKDIQLIKHK